MELIEYKITNKLLRFTDDSIDTTEKISIRMSEYAPRIFKAIRMLEGVNIENMLESFKPMNNQTTISASSGKGGNFFICTDDNQYILKTITVEELELIRRKLINNYYVHIERNKDSLLCRIYGMYKIKFTK